MNACNEKYLLDLKEDDIGHSNVEIQDVFDCLYEWYSKIIDKNVLEKGHFDKGIGLRESYANTLQTNRSS